jgi:putative ABC transport system substrate-binding protein
MRRREFIGGLAGAAAAAPSAWPLPARALPAKPSRIGYFWPGFPDPNVGLAGLRQGLSDRGFVLGRNLFLEERYAEGHPERTPALIAELLALGVDVLVTGGAALIRAHTQTATVPLVGVAADFVGVGLAAGLSRPGGNVTGLSLFSAEFSPKWLEFLKAAVPKLGRVAFLGADSGTIQAEKLRLDETAPRYGVTLTELDLWRDNLEASLGAITSANFDGLIVADDSLAEPLIPRIVALAAENRVPTIYGLSTAVRQGGLMSYSADFFEIWRRLAGPIERVLEGARPGDIPIEQATEIKLAINLKTAKALGIAIPTTLLAAATEVIE